MADAPHDAHWIAETMTLAEHGRWTCAPNPMVGAVVVRGGQAISRGWHTRAGGPHAEIVALAAAGALAHGATLYVSLEPCCTHGRTPPCTDAIIAAGIRRVVVATLDPNPAHQGRGLDVLRAQGIEALCVHDPGAEKLNERFNWFMTTRRPFVHAKWAMSLDGKIATRTGASKWISGPESRARVHQMRSEHDAVMVGIGTVRADNPRLDVRLDGDWLQPTKIVVDSHVATPADARVLEGAQVFIACAAPMDAGRAGQLEAAGAHLLLLPDASGTRVDLSALLDELGRRGISGVLVEGGGTLLGSLFDHRLVQRVTVFIAPVVIGGSMARSPVAGKGIEALADEFRLMDVATSICGEDVVVTGRVGR